MRTLVVVGFVICTLCSFVIGVSWERWRNYEQFIWRFSQYSGHIRGLAERQQIADLTNAVILFDSKFYPRCDPKDLEDVIWQLRKIGPYYQDPETNTSELYVPTNAPSVP